MNAKAALALFVAAGLALTWGLWLAFRPAPTSATTPVSPTIGHGVATDTGATVPVPSTRGTSSAEREFDLVVKKGRLVSGPERLEVQEGDSVIVEIVSDIRDELHVHGYDLRTEIMPSQPARLSFRATRTGRFGLELHRAHTELGALEVYPR